MNNPTLTEFCFGMIGRADIEGSKSNVAMNAWLPQASSWDPTSTVENSSYLGPRLNRRPAPFRAFGRQRIGRPWIIGFDIPRAGRNAGLNRRRPPTEVFSRDN
ncbi:MAG: hypothetical protein E6I91_06270 [Chloroflexi bacterium]|nr:MAG: hypothetical protein E6I91_06270 [Chloroflexota bacterium]